ncbi:MAG TPA: DUF1289 domain-containing protein, partial [Xanthobacteraceae bacterium]|nr:DUF1289 domain-containing protein [Xanthobacteraceae bacterium]
MIKIDTPCIQVCSIDPLLGICQGCGRDLQEIARWRDMTDIER